MDKEAWQLLISTGSQSDVTDVTWHARAYRTIQHLAAPYFIDLHRTQLLTG